MKRLLGCVIVLFSVLANAAAPKLHSARLGGPPNLIYVEFDTKAVPVDCSVEYPAPANCPSAHAVPWTVVVYDSSLHPSGVRGYLVCHHQSSVGGKRFGKPDAQTKCSG